MPAAERSRLLKQVRSEEWARADYDRVKALAAQGDGYWAAFFYALEGDDAMLPAARQKLLAQYGEKSRAVERARNRLADPAFFTAGQPGIPDVYYDLDISGLVAADWAWTGLTPDERRTIGDGILAVARYKMRCMDRWTQTPNLVLKPTFMVAMAGLVTQDPECLEWGLRRKPGSPIGGYFEVLDVMLRDGGPWHEAPIYPIAHEGLYVMSLFSRYRGLYDGADWFGRRTPGGGSPRGLLDYYLATAYPLERTGRGPGQIRCANYGDGSTTAAGADLFLVNPAARPKGGIVMEKALAAAFAASGGDPRYAPFAALIPDYRPALWDAPPLPETRPFPPAPSSIWPTYGLAMLRSDESPAYWTNASAIAVFALMTQGYGHDHRDKFGIMLHGANRLFYPDYNPIQYENPDVGWSRNSVCHNTLVVDEEDTRDATPTAIRHAFEPEVKFLATSADGVYDGVDQTRALLLTREYLLDVFSARSAVPHTYDYVLHSAGLPRPVEPVAFADSTVLETRYWLMKQQQALTTSGPWRLDFVYRDGPFGRSETMGPEWNDHDAVLRLAMAADTNTLVVHGVDAHGMPMLVARRSGLRDTVFVATHEPYVRPAGPAIRAVRVLARGPGAVLVRVEAEGYTDYAAIAWGPGSNGLDCVLAAGDGETAVAFTNYGYLRVSRTGGIAARGGWSAFRIPGAGPVTLNGRPVKARAEGGMVQLGSRPVVPEIELAADPECPVPVSVSPATVRLAEGGRRTVTLTVRNTLREAVAGAVEFRLPVGLTTEPRRPAFGPLAPGEAAAIPVVFAAARSEGRSLRTNSFAVHAPGEIVTRSGGGRSGTPFRVVLARGGGEQATLFQPLTVTVGPTLRSVYRHPLTNVYRVQAPGYTAELDMLNGLCRRLSDDDEVARLDGTPLFTFSDGQIELLFEGSKHAFTWASETPAGLTAHAYDKCRYRVDFGDDRMTLSMDPGWTQFATTYFTVPGAWTSPRGAPRWARIVAADAAGRESEGQPGQELRTAAAELAFPESGWSLAFKFDPPQPVTFKGAGLAFPLGSLTGDRWSVGFCRPGTLEAWRKRAFEEGNAN